ncbi:MAG: endonuclease/exonuclease/phosphatase family protein [Flavobacteriales bacterium]|nr:endonuclease/exonuclease/phosphatase family protein [Flavobacteriales bacterium]
MPLSDGMPEESKAPNQKGTASRTRLSRWHRPLWWLNVAAVAVLLLTYLAPHVSPGTAWPLMLLAFSYPYQLLLHGFLLLWWLVFRRKRMLLTGLALLLGWGHVGDHIGFFGRSSMPDDVTGAPVKLMSWNVRLFDLYNWDGNERTRDAIFRVLHKQSPGILCLQEYFQSSDKRYFRTREALAREFGFVGMHEHFTFAARNDQHFGISTWSRHPIVGKGNVDFGRRTNNVCIWSDIAIGDDTIRVYNAHLSSYHFGDEDYRFIAELDADTQADSLKSGSWRILMRLKEGAIHRADEARLIAAHMAHCPYPAVFCGDINDVPMSYAYHLLRNDMDDAFHESGRGMGGTYVGDLPRLRIDHILHDEAIASWSFRTLPDELSDHLPITAEIAVR